MDFNDIKDAMKFFNWEMIAAIAVLTTAWVQLLKRYLPEMWAVGKAQIPVIVLTAFASGFVFAHLIFDISGVQHTETIALFHGFAGTLFSLLGYEIIKGTTLGLRSSTEIKDGKGGQTGRASLKLLSLLAALMLAFGVMAGCASTGAVNTTVSTKADALKNPFVIDAYKQLFAVAQTYNAAWLTFRDLHKVGIVNDADYAAGQTVARQYRQAHQDAVDALILVEKGVYSQGQAQVMLTLALSLNKQIIAYLGPRIQQQKGGK